MAFQSKQRSARSTEKKQETAPCITCGMEVPPKAVHCSGSQVAYGCLETAPHHGSQLWPDCWHCHRPMGCTHCVPGAYRREYQGQWLNADLICTRCRLKVTLESFLNGGPISRFSLTFDFKARKIGHHEAKGVPGMEAYPRPWITAYANQRAAAGRLIEDDERGEFMGLLKGLRGIVRDTSAMDIPTRRELQVERNRQVAGMESA